MCRGVAGPDTRVPVRTRWEACGPASTGAHAQRRARAGGHEPWRPALHKRAADHQAHSRAGGRPPPRPLLWPTSVGAGGPRETRLSWGLCPGDGSVSGVHLPDVGTLHTAPGEGREAEDCVRHWGNCASEASSGPGDIPHVLIPHQPCSGPGLNSLRQEIKLPPSRWLAAGKTPEACLDMVPWDTGQDSPAISHLP